jgi:hypothetical protein
MQAAQGRARVGADEQVRDADVRKTPRQMGQDRPQVQQSLPADPYAWRVILKWGTLIVVWLVLGSLYDWVGLIGLIVLIGYAIHRIRLDRRQEQIAAYAPAPMAARTLSSSPMHFNPPPG